MYSEKERTVLTKKVNKATLLLRALVSVYILYLAYGLMKDYGTAENQMVSLVAIIVFVAGGGLILASSAYKLIKGDYDDGSMDEEEPVREIETSKEEQSAEDAGAGQEADRDHM